MNGHDNMSFYSTLGSGGCEVNRVVMIEVLRGVSEFSGLRLEATCCLFCTCRSSSTS